MKRRPTQKQMILISLKMGDKLTVLDSIKRFGIYALSQRIGELKREGYPIKSKPYSWTTEYGEHKTVSVYWMDNGEN